MPSSPTRRSSRDCVSSSVGGCRCCWWWWCVDVVATFPVTSAAGANSRPSNSCGLTNIRDDNRNENMYSCGKSQKSVFIIICPRLSAFSFTVLSIFLLLYRCVCGVFFISALYAVCVPIHVYINKKKNNKIYNTLPCPSLPFYGALEDLPASPVDQK